jgi:hypothetical protein
VIDHHSAFAVVDHPGRRQSTLGQFDEVYDHSTRHVLAALISEKKVLNGPSLTLIPLFDRICSPPRLAGGHARSTAVLKSCCHTGDPHGRHGLMPSPAFLNNEVTVTDSTQF